MQTVLPVWVLQLMSKYSNRRNLKHARHTAQLANAVTRQLVDSKAEALLQGKGNKDILSLLGSGRLPYFSSNATNPVTSLLWCGVGLCSSSERIGECKDKAH